MQGFWLIRILDYQTSINSLVFMGKLRKSQVCGSVFVIKRAMVPTNREANKIRNIIFFLFLFDLKELRTEEWVVRKLHI